MKANEAYTVGNVNLYNVRNRYERRVIKSIQRLIAVTPLNMLTEKDIMDIYALALNQLPAHYTQTGTIVLGDPYPDKVIDEVVLKAYDKINDYPKP